MPPSISVSLSVSPSVSLGHFHSVCSSTPSPFVHTTQHSHPICLDKEGLARRSFGNGLGLHQWLNWDASEDVSFALGGCSCGWHGHSFDQNGGCFLLIQTCSLMSTWCDSEDNLQHYFLHTLFPVVLRCQTSNCIQSSCDSWTFPNSSIRCVFYTHRWCIVAQALTKLISGSVEVNVIWKLGSVKPLQAALNCKPSFCLVVTWYSTYDPARALVGWTVLVRGQFYQVECQAVM